jgi:hypothetical protein
VARPGKPEGVPEVETPQGALAWLERLHGRTP